MPANGLEDIRVQSGCVFTLKKLTSCVFNFVRLYPQDGGKKGVFQAAKCVAHLSVGTAPSVDGLQCSSSKRYHPC